MIKDLPVLLIVIPLLCAFIIPITDMIKKSLSWYLATITTFICLTGSISLLCNVLETGKISYWLGGWEPPWGIEYAIDYLNSYILCIITLMSFIVAIYAKKSVELEIDKDRIPAFYAIYILFVAGLMGIVITGDIFNLYVFLEISSLASYALIAIGKKRKALVASYKYLVMGTIGATFILLGIGHLYMVTGSLNMADLREILPALYQSKVAYTAFTFLVIGLSIKIALFPLHNWLPGAYTYSPNTVSAIIAATSTKVSAYVLMRIIFTVFKPEFVISEIQHLLLFFSATAIISGSILAIAQTNIKKMLAYSSIGQIGYIILGIALLNQTGIKGALLHILNHALMKGSLFLVVGAVVYRTGIINIDDFKGLSKKMPVSMAAFTVGALSMVGIPLTVGFVSKWYLAIASLQAGMWFLIPVILVSSLLMLVYFWRIIDNIYFQPCSTEKQAKEAPVLMLGPTIATATLCIIFGVLASIPLSIVEKASIILLK